MSIRHVETQSKHLAYEEIKYAGYIMEFRPFKVSRCAASSNLIVHIDLSGLHRCDTKVRDIDSWSLKMSPAKGSTAFMFLSDK